MAQKVTRMKWQKVHRIRWNLLSQVWRKLFPGVTKKQIAYRLLSVEHNYYFLFRYSYMFRSFSDIIGILM